MSFGFGFGLPEYATLAGGFTPASLFTAGEQGAWYDPSDINLNWRRNLLTYTEQFDNAAWTTVSINAFGSGSVANTLATLDPIGGNTADYIQENNTNNAHGITAGISVVVGQTYTASVYAKKAQRNWLRLFFGGQPDTWFDLNNGVRGTVGAGVTASITDVGNGWYRCAITSTASLTGSLGIRISDANGVTAYLGTGTDGIFIWGAQLELGSTASAYQQIVTPEITYVQTVQSNPVLFTDSAGTTPVTAVEQAVGLMLDKSQGLALGSELVTNGDFSSGTTTGWNVLSEGPVTPTLSIVGGALQTTYTTVSGAGRAGAYQAITTVAGTWYKVSGIARHVAGTDRQASVRIGTGSGNDYAGYTIIAIATTVAGSTFTAFTAYFLATAASTTILLVSAGTGLASTFTDQFDNLSVQSLAGNHAISYNPTTARPVLSARVNLLTYSEQFDDAAWAKDVSGTPVVSISANSTTAPDGTVTADTLTELAVTNFHRIVQSFTFASGVTYTYSVYVKNASGSRYVGLSPVGSSAAGNNCTAVFDLPNKTYLGVQTAGGTLFGSVTSPTITELANGWFRLSLSVSATPGGAGGPSVWLLNTFVNNGTNQGSYAGDGTSGIFIWGADLRLANIGTSVPAYQRIADAYTYDSNGFPRYLKFDGIDDGMYTPANLNLSGTDKATVFAGVRKLSDASVAVVAETSIASSTNNGTLGIFAPQQMAANYGVRARGNADNLRQYLTYTAPITNVLSAQLTTLAVDSAASQSVRINAVSVAGAGLNTGNSTGNFGTYPLYIGSRNNGSLWLNGYLYSLIVVGAASTAAQISSTESWINVKEGTVFSPPAPGFAVLPSSGSPTYTVTRTVLDSAGTSYSVPATVLDSAGTSYTPI